MRRFICALSLLLAFTTSPYAQVAAKNQQFVLDDFSGGLNTKISPLSLPKGQADIVENIRFDTELKSLTKRDKIIPAYTNSDNEASTSLYRLYLNDGTKVTLNTHDDSIDKCTDGTATCTKILTLSVSGHKFDWVTWHNIAIGTDGYNQPVKYDGTSASATYLGAPLAADAGSGAGPNGTYTYKVSCYTTSYEVSLNVPSNSVTVSDNDINLTMIPICPDAFQGEDVLGRKVYRNANAVPATWKLLSNGTITNNSDTTLTDSDADGALGATYPSTYVRQVPLAKYALVHKNRLWLGNNPTYPSRLYFSDDGGQDYFGYLTDSQGEHGGYFNIRPDDGDEITFIENLLGKLTVSKSNTIQKMDTDGDTPSTDWAISDPYSFIGCQAPHSVVNSPVGLIYLGSNGIYTFNGQYSQLISEAVTPEIQDISPSNYANVWGTFFKNTYYMAYTSLKSGSSVNNRVLVLDLLAKAFDIDTLGLSTLAVFNSGSDVEALYSTSSSTGKIYAHTETIKEMVHKNHSDFTGSWDDARYVPTTAGGTANSPVLEIAWTDTINGSSGTIDSVISPSAVQTTNAHTVFLFEADGNDAATVDTADTGQVVTFIGNAQLDTADKKFGSAAFLLDGNGDYGRVTDDSVFSLGSGDFTLATWFSTAATADSQYFFGQYTDNDNYWHINKGSDFKLYIYFRSLGKDIFSYYTDAIDFKPRRWYHVAWTRKDGIIRCFLNGVSQPVTLNKGNSAGLDVGDVGGWFYIGWLNGAYYFNGHMDDVLIDKGHARWDSSFSPIIDRPDTDGTYTSPYLTLGAQEFDKLYWNEIIPSTGGNVTVALRSGATSSDCAATTWSSEFTNPVGSDVSGTTADTIVQYRISMAADNIQGSPTLVLRDNYVIKLTYNTMGTTDESSIDMAWRSGWIDLAPGYKKTLKKIYAYYDVPDNAEGTLNIKVENFEGDEDTFAINYGTHPSYYSDYFTNGALLGEVFRISIDESSLNQVQIKKLVFVYDVEPLY